MSKTLRLILGDQLNEEHSWYIEPNNQVCYVMFEMRQETDYVRHHVQKVVAFFAAMRTFARKLEEDGHTVIYYTINDPKNTQNLTKNIEKVLALINAPSVLPMNKALLELTTSVVGKLTPPPPPSDSQANVTSPPDGEPSTFKI